MSHDTVLTIYSSQKYKDEGHKHACTQHSTKTQVDINVHIFAVNAQGLLKKHEAFETDLEVHRERVADIESAGNKLIEDGNHQSELIEHRISSTKVKSFFENGLY